MVNSRRGSKDEEREAATGGLTSDILRQELTNFKKELKEEITTTVRAAVSMELRELQQKVVQQQKEIDVLKKYIINLELSKLKDMRRSLSSNVILRGVPEEENESEGVLMEKVQDVCDAMSSSVKITQVERVGKKSQDRPRPIRAITGSRDERNSLLQKSRSLRNDSTFQNVYLDTDKCYLDRKESTRIRLKAKQLRLQNPLAIVKIRKGILLVDDEIVDAENPLNHVFPSN